MTYRQAACVVLIVVAVLGLGPSAVSAQETATETAANATDVPANETGTAAGLGTQLTAFLQSSSASANDTVENAMWKASFDHANESRRARLVTSRTETLRQRLDRLQTRNETLRTRYENGAMARSAYVAQQSRLAARIDGLQAAVNDTDAAATEVGVSSPGLDRLKTDARRLRGPQVAEIARGLGGGPPLVRPGKGGPPQRAGAATGNGNADGPTKAGNQTNGDGRSGAPAGGDSGTSGAGASSGSGNTGPPADSPGNGNSGRGGSSSLDVINGLVDYLGTIGVPVDW